MTNSNPIKTSYLSRKRANSVDVDILMRKEKGILIKSTPLKKTLRLVWRRAA